MTTKKARLISILVPVLALASAFAIYYEYTDLSAHPGQSAPVIHTNDYAASLGTAFQASSGGPSQRNNPTGTIVTSKRSDLIEFSSKRLNNNLWGAPPEEKLTSEVYLNENKTFGWHWDRPNPLMKSGINGYQPIYPNIKIGGNPWEPSKTTYFPVRVSEIKTLIIESEYIYRASPTGTYNLAYDMFLSDTNQASSDPRPRVEVMVWLHHTLQQPPDSYKGDLTDGINTYKFYSFTMPNGRLYYAFIMKEQTQLQAHHTVNAGKLMENLGLDPMWYLHGVELGNEVVNGTGDIEINKIIVNLNGQEM
jgi:hypothetical protein